MRARNEGSITKINRKRRDGSTYLRYQAIVSIGVDGEGKLIRSYGPFRITREEARADLAAMRQSADMGVAPDKEPLADYLLQWVEDINVKKRTRDTYRADIKNHINPVIGNVRLCDLTPAHVNTMLRKARKGSQSTARKARSVLHNALEDARLEERIVRNPVSVTAVPPKPKADLTRWQPAHAAAFVEAARAHHNGTVFLLSLTTGLRIGEALGLMWHDLSGDVLAVRRQLRTVGDPMFDTLKTKRSERKLRIGADVLGMLLDHRTKLQDDGLYREGEYEAEWGTQEGALMFPNPIGKPTRLDVLRKDYAAILDAAKVPRIRIHDLRHYHLSKLISMGVDVATVSRRAGHSRTSTTLDVYVEAFDDLFERLSVSFEDMTGAGGTAEVQQKGREEQGSSGNEGGEEAAITEDSDVARAGQNTPSRTPKP